VKIDPEGRVHTFCHAVRGKWHMMGVNLSAGGSLQWFRNELCKADAAQAKRKEIEVYDVLSKEAEAVRPGSQGLFFLPYLSGERTPHADPDARGAFTGLSIRHDRGALARAVLEGVAYGLRDSLELLRALGVEPRVGRVSGGGARSDLWLRIVASVLRLPLERMENEDGSAFGAALLGGVRAGLWPSAEAAVATCVRMRETIEPVESWAGVYDEGYERFRALYPATSLVDV
jgi:xylulokinase